MSTASKLHEMRFANAVTEHVSPRIGRDSAHCILAARIVIDLAHRFGIAADAVPVAIVVGNDLFRRWCRAIGYVPSAPVPRDAMPPGVRAVSARAPLPGEAPRALGWGGHLIVALGDGLLVDPTLGLFTRESVGIHMPTGITLDVSSRGAVDAWFRGDTGRLVEYVDMGSAGTGIVALEPAPANRNYTGTSDWDGKLWQYLANQLEPTIREAMASR